MRDRCVELVVASRGDVGALLVPGSPLTIETVETRGRRLDLLYAPFDHVGTRARIVVVGLTPGRRQAENALRTYAGAVLEGRAFEEALGAAKAAASFSGPMRRNLVRMLDRIGVARLLGLHSASALWDEAGDLVHFTSLVRHPLLVDGANWSGNPDPVADPLTRWTDDWTGPELASLTPDLVVPLGPAVASGVQRLVHAGAVRSETVLRGLPHPSGANAERIACFLGDKAPEVASSRTDGHALSATREGLAAQIMALERAATGWEPFLVNAGSTLPRQIFDR